MNIHNPKGNPENFTSVTTKNYPSKSSSSVNFSSADQEMIREISEALGVSKAEAVRTAIRSYYAILISNKKLRKLNDE